MKERNLDFDKIIDRRNTKCLKYDFAERRGYPEDILPLWVADMDFKTSSYVEDALEEIVKHNIYGYCNTQPGDGFFEAVSGWMARHHNWEVKGDWHIKTPGVCFAISTAVRAFTDPSDPILIQQPVYYPFENIIKQNGRSFISSDLVEDETGKWIMDPVDFEDKIIKNGIKLFILCNPQNPVGRSWSFQELKTIGTICKDHGVTVFSDEIHSDFVWSGQHTVFQEVDPSFREFTVTATSPSKTFNLAGLQQSNVFIPNKDLKQRFRKELDATGYEEPNIFGIEAATAVYEHGDEWYDAMKAYVEVNIDVACTFINEKIPGAKIRKPEATYLLWLDLNDTGLDWKQLDNLIINKAKLWLDAGWIFGKPGRGFQRINVACPRSVLNEALERLCRVMTDEILC